MVPGGSDVDWEGLAAKLMDDLSDILATGDHAAFERRGSILLHEGLPDHPALRDPEFWIWLAVGPGMEVILRRYPASIQPPSAPTGKPRNPLPANENFFGSRSRETLFFRLWIRVEMARQSVEHDPYDFVRRGAPEFWRSHVFRQRYAWHGPFLEALVDFQFPGPAYEARLGIDDLRALVKEIRLVCANVSVEALDRAQCAGLIERTHADRVAWQPA